MMDSVFQAEWLDAAGLWVGLIFSLLVFSAILGDHLLARLAQYVLVGAVLGHAVAVVWQSVAWHGIGWRIACGPGGQSMALSAGGAGRGHAGCRAGSHLHAGAARPSGQGLAALAA